MPVYEYLCNDCGPFTDMRPMAECDDPQDCPQCESRIAARDPHRAGVLLHAVRQAESARHQRTQRQRAEDAWRIQGLARSGLRLLFEQETGAAGDQTKSGAKGFPTARPWMISH